MGIKIATFIIQAVKYHLQQLYTLQQSQSLVINCFICGLIYSDYLLMSLKMGV